jgi:type I restriction enzyme, S subunit
MHTTTLPIYTEKLLQSGWRRVRLGDVVECVNEVVTDLRNGRLQRVVGLEHLDPGSLHITRWASIEDGTSFTRRFRPGQVLFGKRRVYLRKVAVAEFDGICSGDILVFQPKCHALTPELLPFIIQTEAFWEHALHTSAGSLSPRTKWQDLARYEFALPPQTEQRRIADLLWAADYSVECLRRVDASVEGVIQASTRNFLASDRFREAPCGDLLIEKPKNGYSPNTSIRGVPTLSISAIRDGEVQFDGNLKYADVSVSEIEKFILNSKDVLVVRGNGNRNLVGRAGIVRKAPKSCFYPDLLIRLRFNEGVMRPEFACIQWNSDSAHRVLIKKAKSTNGIWKINGKDVSQHVLKVPPLDAQDWFLAQVEEFTRSRNAASAALRSSESLKLSLIRDRIPSKQHVQRSQQR